MIKTFTKQNIKTNPLWIRLLITTFMLLIGTGSAWAWGYKSAGGSWNDCTGSFSSITYYTTPTGSTTKSLDVIMKTKPGSGFNICQNTCSGQQLYVGLTGTASSSANTIVRGTAYWNNGLYSTYTVVIPDGKIYIKPTGGSAIEMTKSSYTYTASVQLSSAKTFDLYANDPGASISNENSMPSAGKPSSVRLNYTGLSSPYQYVTVSYDLKTNKITFTEEAAPCTPSATITEATYSCYGTTIHLEGNLTEACDGMYYGWQYKTTSGDDWSAATAIAGHATNNYSESATTYELDWTIPNPGTTYYFRAYATPDANTWYSDDTTEPVKTYKSPTLYAVSGSDATLTLSDSESGYTYTLYNNNDNLVSNSATEGTGNALSWPLNDSGTYTVKAKPAESSCDEVLMTGSYTYDPCSPANYTVAFANSATTVNKGSKLQASVSPSGNGYGSVTWSSSATGVATVSSTGLITGVKGGQATITATVAKGDTYCGGSATKTITVKETPTVQISGTQEFCGASTTLTANVTGITNGVSYSIAWYKDGGATSVATGATYNASASGTYTAKVTGTYINTKTSAGYAINNNTPTISGATFTQPGQENAIELTVPTGNDTKWTVNKNGDLSVATGSSTMFSAENKDTYTITADYNGCTDTHDVTVSDAFYIWVRNAKEGETAYANFYYPDQNSPEFRGGVMFYAECTELPTANTYTTYNEGGREADLVQNDCDGYTWYGFRASADVISGSKYFYVRARNDKNTAGWYTHTVPTKVIDFTGDVYYTLCETNVTDCNEGSKGWKIVSASAPYSGPVINATDDSFNSNNFADFAALYVTDCSGKEIAGYQWYKGNDEYVSKCDYVTKDGTVQGDAGKTNNIRPTEAGNYSCKVTYKDGSSKTSEAFPVEATSGTTYADFNSPIPVIMVNTGSKDFPSCPVANETASKHADKMKKKLSVDVKILHNGSIVYDRKARMAYRGSSSLNFQKKSYAFCPGDANCGDADKGPDYVKTAKLNMLGIGEATDKDWVLYAAAADPSMLRNRMVFDTYQAMTGNWGVHSHYVELIINGEYKGVYLMMDKVTQNKKRVNVEWDVKDETKRGFILKFDKTDIVDRSVDYPDGDEKTFLSKYSGKHNIGTYDTTNDQAFEIEYPEKEDIQEDGGDWYDVIDYIKGMFNSFEEALAAGDYTTVQQYIDYESWADWFILNEFTKNVDAYRASCVFTYDGTKIKANPLWDQELSFNNQSVHANRHIGDTGNKGCENVTGLLIKNGRVYSDGFAAPFWFTGTYVSGRGTYNGAATTFAGALLNDPCFVQTVKNRWEIHKQGALSKASLETLIAAYETELTSAVRDREANFWSSNGYKRSTLSCPWGSNSTGYYDDTYADAKADITAWISDAAASGSTGRRAGLDAAIDDLEGTGLTISFEPMNVETTPWMPVTITVNNESGYQYTLTYTDGELDKQANVIIEKSGDTYKYHVPRPAAWNKGDEAADGERTDIVYGLKATLQMGDDKVVCGSSNNGEAPSATATIILKDEPNENCPQ